MFLRALGIISDKIIHKRLETLRTQFKQHRIDSNYRANTSELLNIKIIVIHGQIGNYNILVVLDLDFENLHIVIDI